VAERKRRRDIMRTGTKQQKWELAWEERYARYKNVGVVAGPRDTGVVTPSGIRVPAEPGNMLTARPFYEREMAGFLAWQGFIHYAEIVEMGHDAAARELALKTNRGFPLKDNQLDLAGYTGWAYKAKAAREAVEAAMLFAGGLTALQQVLVRGASRTFAATFTRVTNQSTGAGTAMTVNGVGIGNIFVYRRGGELFANYGTIINASRIPGQGRAMHAAFEQGAVQAARAAGATTARVGVYNIQNKAWYDYLWSRGYRPDMLQSHTGFTNYMSKVFNL
jgi:hypothetical protein